MKLLEIKTVKMYNSDSVIIVNKSDTDKFKKLGFSLKASKPGNKTPEKNTEKVSSPESGPNDKDKQTGAV